MSRITESFLKVQYDLRPSKQVERRMLVDAFQLLGQAGFPIQDYRYTGMGSVYFVDFAIAHRYLGIRKLLSVEISPDVAKRVDFNRPFGLVEVEIGSIGAVIPRLSRDESHILWLDYDDVITRSQLEDLAQAVGTLCAGSVLLVTVDGEPPGEKTAGPTEWSQYFHQEAADWLPAQLQTSDFARSKLPELTRTAFATAIEKGLAGRSQLKFAPLFNFEYADGHRMLTFGGMLVGPSEARRLNASALSETIYYRGSIVHDPFRIRVPVLTKKERMLLDRAMPCNDDWVPTDFEIKPEDLNSYREIYRFLPTYGELFL